jgi:hypothetical protein
MCEKIFPFASICGPNLGRGDLIHIFTRHQLLPHQEFDSKRDEIFNPLEYILPDRTPFTVAAFVGNKRGPFRWVWAFLRN